MEGRGVCNDLTADRRRRWPLASAPADDMGIETDLRLLRQLLDQGAEIDGAAIQIGVETWAVHGRIPVDGDVIMAEFDNPDAARAAIERLPDQPARTPTNIDSHIDLGDRV